MPDSLDQLFRWRNNDVPDLPVSDRDPSCHTLSSNKPQPKEKKLKRKDYLNMIQPPMHIQDAVPALLIMHQDPIPVPICDEYTLPNNPRSCSMLERKESIPAANRFPAGKLSFPVAGVGSCRARGRIAGGASTIMNHHARLAGVSLARVSPARVPSRRARVDRVRAASA